MPEFAHLHCHTQYSLLDGAARIDQLTQRAAQMDLGAVAITDHGNLYGVPEFYHKAREAGVKPIIGCEFYLTPSGIQDQSDQTRYHQVILAKDHEGYQNLMTLSSKSFTDGFYYKPRIDKDLLRRHHEGLVATTCCLQGEVLQTILERGEAAARAVFETYLEIFGDDYYVELQDHGIDEQETCNQILLKWAKEYEVDILATNDVHYIDQADADAQDILLCLQTGKDYHDPNRMRFENDQFFLKGLPEMRAAFSDLDDKLVDRALDTTQKVADKCTFDLPTPDLLMPHYPIPEQFGDDMDAYLRHKTFERAKERYGEPLSQRVVDRLNHELGIIGEMGYAGYFLIVQDFTDAARELDVRVGPGRGSAAGSCVSYCLGITNVDPLKYDLLFERFLNPERVSMPDIDIDFDDRGRSKVIDYVVEKYGRENVCQIVTFNRMGAKTAIRDVSRVLGLSLDRVDEISEMVPDGPGVDLDQAFEEEPEFRALRRDEDPKVRQMMQYAEVLEGAARHTGVHAAGVIIAPGDVSDYVPISTTKSKGERIVTTQYDGDWIEEFGLLKMDFLGLKTLTVLEDALALIEENHGDQIDLGEVPLDDPETFELFQRGDTTGIFQFESTGMREWLRKLEPTEVNDLIAMNALYRPGPMDLIPDYVARKHGEEEVQYPHPLLEDVLEPTYGIAVFQEQVMEMARVLAGFSLGEADILRRAMGKKDQKKMAKQREAFVRGCAEENGIGEGEANELFDIIAKFAGYGFNKCLTGDTEIVDASTGRRVKLIDVVEGRESDVTVASMDEERMTIAPRRVVDAFSSGEAQTFTLTTRTGRQIRATANHPIYTPDGWTHLGDLEDGDRVAVPRHIPYEPSASWDEHELVVLGYALSEGNLCHPHSFYVYTSCEEELADYQRHLERFDNTAATVDRSKSAASLYARRGNIDERCEAADFIEELGLNGLTATEKHVPEAAFRLPPQQLAVLLGRLWTGDGCIAPKQQDVYYATSSERLARDVQHLLLRLEIPSTLHEKSFSYRGGRRPGYTVRISSKEIETFARRIGPHLVGKRKRDLETLLDGSISRGRMTQDVVPVSVFPEMKEAARTTAARKNISMKELMRRADASYKLLFLDEGKKGYARETIRKIADATDGEALGRWAESEVYWDEVASVEENGVEEVYDLTVEGTHNFVAGDLVVHNSHSAAYSLVAYRTAFLKAHYPAEFMAAAMTNDLDKTDKLTKLLEEADKMNLDVLPPSVNRSAAHFTVDEGQIRFGLGAVKGVGMGAVESIVEARGDAEQAFADLFDLVEEIDLRQANKGVIEALARSGAMDELEGHRAQLVEAADDAVRHGQKAQADAAAGQHSLFGEADAETSAAMQPSLPDVESWSKARALKEEREVTGFYVSGHPLESFRAEAEAFATAKLGQTERFDQQQATPGGDGYSRQRGPKHAFCGILTEVDFNTTRKGKPIGFATLEDFSGRGDLVIFANVLDRVRQYLEVDRVVLVKGETEVRGGTTNVVVNDIVPMWKVREQMVQSLTLRLNPDRTEPSKIRALRRLCEEHVGSCQLYFDLVVPGLAEPQRVRSRKHMIEPTQPLMKGIRRLFGNGRLTMEKRS